MSFKDKGYVLVRDFIPEYLSNFLYSYIHLKKKVFYTLRDQKIISPYNLDWGSRGDTMMPNTFSLYGDTPLDALLAFVKEKVEKKSGLKLNESYSYARIYEKGDVLKKHVDRKSCAVSATLNLGGDSWPIYLLDKNNIKIKALLKPGDALLYQGTKVLHWREVFKGEYCGQLFLHYVNKKKNKPYDNRLHLGLPESIHSCGLTINQYNKRG